MNTFRADFEAQTWKNIRDSENDGKIKRQNDRTVTKFILATGRMFKALSITEECHSREIVRGFK